MDYIKSKLSEDIAKKIIGNKESATKYLIELNNIAPIPLLITREITRGLNAGQMILKHETNEIWALIVQTWNYDISKSIIRSIFKNTKKYNSGKEADNAMEVLLNEWNTLELGEISWPFSQGAFDDFVQRINSENSSGICKDKKVKLAAVKYRRIKEINTVRNDFIETLIFEKNNNILPTLNHRRGVDFFIDGISYDQKVAKSPTNEFKRSFGSNWREHAINHPEVVAEYLYKYQDEGRFGADPRLLVVYIDEDVSIDRIKEQIDNTNLDKALEINFSFKHHIQGEKHYKVPCFIILLHN
jgi:hypothetical protein